MIERALDRLKRLGTAVVGAALVVAAAAASGPGAAEAGRAAVLGRAAPVPASCPAQCLVEARVTAFQTSIAGSKKNPFVVPARGRIVAWSIKLGRPSKPDIRAFTKSFGAAKARISILKPVRTRSGKRKYRLVRQSPVMRLGPFFGEVTTFGLGRALAVKKGQIVALTTPTWMPAFAGKQSATTRWRASRKPQSGVGGCSDKQGLANVAAGSAHSKRGTQRYYACAYRGSRLLYSARFIRQGKR
jgi:hypothetical protein